MHQAGETGVFIPSYCFTYPVESVQYFPLPPRAGRSQLFRISLGHRPSLQHLRYLLTQYCSVPSSVLLRCLTSHWLAYQDYGHRPSLTDPPGCCLTATNEISRFSNIERPRMLRVLDSVGSVSGSLHNAEHRIALPFGPVGRHPKRVISELNSWPTLSPVNASRATSRPPAHDSGP